MEDATAPSVLFVSLLALPRDALRTVLRFAGRPVRGACRALRDGYGPLDGGLCLEHLTPGRGCHLCDSTTAALGGHRHIQTLVLSPHRDTHHANSQRGFDPIDLILLFRPLPATFPALRTLHLAAPITLDRSLLHHLAPLAPRLTSLTACFADLPSLATLATTLTSLHMLALCCWGCDTPDSLSTLQPLAPTLLRLRCTTAGMSSAAHVLRSLATFTRLTHLDLPVCSWDHEAFVLLATPTVMPRLQALRLQYLDGFPRDPHLADDIWAALARRTALTSLTAACEGLPSSPPALRLAQLCLIASKMHAGICEDPVPLLEALAPSQTLTHLEFGNDISSGPPVVNPLCLFADTLLSLRWVCCPASPAALLPLSRLTRLESLTLQMAPGSDEHLPWESASSDDEYLPDLQAASDAEHLAGEQAASAIAAALPRLTSLVLQPTLYPRNPSPLSQHCLAALFGAVARQGALRHLALGRWDLQWGSSLLAHLATSLARLTLPAHPDNVLQVVESVSHLPAMLCLSLSIQVDGVGGSSSSISGAAGRGQHAGRERPSGRGYGPGQGEAGALRVQLPPRLRQLCMWQRDKWTTFPGAHTMEALQAAAARQDCVVRVDWAEPPLSSVRRPQHDDCHGYRDGASAEWVEAWRLQQEEKKRRAATHDA